MSSVAEKFDVVVLGAGPAGQSAALELARLGRRVCVVEARSSVGGVCLHEGTIPSKSLREAVLATVAYGSRQVLGEGRVPAGKQPDARVLLGHVETVVARELGVIDRLLHSTGVQVLHGRARFVAPHQVEVAGHGRLQADFFVVATGSLARRPKGVPFDGKRVVDSDDLLPALSPLPGRLLIVGAGVVGMEYASVFAVAGVEVHLLFRGERPLEFVDQDLVAVCVREFEAQGGRLHPRADVQAVEAGSHGVRVVLEGGRALEGDLVLYAVGRRPATEGLGLEAVGVELEPWGAVAVGPDHRTRVEHIFAVGDVAGGPTLASTAKVHGRIAARAICGMEVEPVPAERIPAGIFTVPEIAWVGPTEAELARSGRPYVVGRAFVPELARGEMLGVRDGLIKLLVEPESKEILGCGVAGPLAVELVHAAKVAREGRLTLDAFCEGVWNYPTFSEGYRVAALDAEARMAAPGRRDDT